jgi:hypothetical protein
MKVGRESPMRAHDAADDFAANYQHNVMKGLRLDRSTAQYIYKAKKGKLLVVLTPLQKAKLIFEQYIQTLFYKGLF